MKNYIRIEPNELNFEIFKNFNDSRGLILAGGENGANAMPVLNAMGGYMWGKNVVAVAIEPLRYTKEFIDIYDYFTINFFDKSYDNEISIVNKYSGRNTNKMQKSGLPVEIYKGVPYFSNAQEILFCKKIFVEEFREASFYDKNILSKNYAFKEFHTLYIAEIERVFKLDK